MFKSGFVAILGRPNVGKSTFLNHVMGQKIAIMSDKAQTTRNKIMGIYTTDSEQIVFIDTPGIHKPKTALGDFMVESAYSTLREVDTVLFMVPADEARGKGDDMIMERLKQAKVPVILVINKIDKVHPDQLLEKIEDYSAQMDFQEIVPISALQGNNIPRLLEILKDNLGEGFQYFPADQITDHPERFLVSEMIREKVLLLTREEVPHSVAVVVDSMKRDEETDKVHIRATIMVERDSQKGIIIGKKGGEVENLRLEVAKLVNKDVAINIKEERKAGSSAQLAAENVAMQLERRVAFRRAMKKVIQGAQKAGTKGIKVSVAGRLGGAEMARTEWYLEGRVPLHTLRARIDYGFAEAHTTYGNIGVKVWIFKGEVLQKGIQADKSEETTSKKAKRARRGK